MENIKGLRGGHNNIEIPSVVGSGYFPETNNMKVLKETVVLCRQGSETITFSIKPVKSQIFTHEEITMPTFEALPGFQYQQATCKFHPYIVLNFI